MSSDPRDRRRGAPRSDRAPARERARRRAVGARGAARRLRAVGARSTRPSPRRRSRRPSRPSPPSASPAVGAAERRPAPAGARCSCPEACAPLRRAPGRRRPRQRRRGDRAERARAAADARVQPRLHVGQRRACARSRRPSSRSPGSRRRQLREHVVRQQPAGREERVRRVECHPVGERASPTISVDRNAIATPSRHSRWTSRCPSAPAPHPSRRWNVRSAGVRRSERSAPPPSAARAGGRRRRQRAPPPRPAWRPLEETSPSSASRRRRRRMSWRSCFVSAPRPRREPAVERRQRRGDPARQVQVPVADETARREQARQDDHVAVEPGQRVDDGLDRGAVRPDCVGVRHMVATEEARYPERAAALDREGEAGLDGGLGAGRQDGEPRSGRECVHPRRQPAVQHERCRVRACQDGRVPGRTEPCERVRARDHADGRRGRRRERDRRR